LSPVGPAKFRFQRELRVEEESLLHRKVGLSNDERNAIEPLTPRLACCDRLR